MPIRKAVIPAAGLGTRFLPATKAQPKEMLPIVDKPTIQYIVEEAVRSGIEDIIIITGRTKKAIEDHFDRSIELEFELERTHKDKMLQTVREISDLANIHYIRQKEARGLGHAVHCASAFIGNEPFAVLLGDDVIHSKTPALRQLIDVHERTGASVLGVQRVPRSEVCRYGIVRAKGELIDGVCKVQELVEKPAPESAPSDIAIMGRYIIDPAIFPILGKTAPGAIGEIQLTDGLNTLAKTHPMFACEFEGLRYDVGDKMGFLAATVEFALRRGELKEAFGKYLANLSGVNENIKKYL